MTSKIVDNFNHHDLEIQHLEIQHLEIQQLEIRHLGIHGDGVALLNEETIFIPYALPQEIVNIERDGDKINLLSILKPSPLRKQPECDLFMRCGGCVSQHMDAETVKNWKTQRVINALNQAGLKGDITQYIHAQGEGRRRVTWHVRTIEGVLTAGLMAPRTHNLVKVDHCPILSAPLQKSAHIAVKIAACLTREKKPLDVQITATQTGLDIDIRGYGKIHDNERQALIKAALALDVARVCIHGEIVIEHRSPTISMGRHTIALPPASFLQVTQAGEDALGDLVCEALKKSKNIADLFAGCGPFTLRLAQNARVAAFETHEPSLKVLEKTIKHTSGIKPVSVQVRDLFRRPLLPHELKAFDSIVLDPPRAGASAQVTQIALAKVPRVMMISCDAGTFARDAALLVEAGYRLGAITLIDQFIHSQHIEIACLLSYG